MKPLILTIISCLLFASVSAQVTPPANVQQILKPILDACAEAATSHGDRQNAAFYSTAKLAGALFTEKTKASDEALVVLMAFYIGESTGEDLIHQVTVRGKRMLPFLLKYRDANVIFLDRKYPSSILLPADVRKEDFEQAIKNVRAGTIQGED
jgi:hypothetical protein